MKLRYSALLFALAMIFACSDKTNSIQLLKISPKNESIKISNAADETILKEYMNSLDKEEFRKLVMLQSNGDKLVVEQKDNDGYLVLLTIRHEQFMIEKQPRNIIEVSKIMNQYLLEKDAIMSEINFY